MESLPHKFSVESDHNDNKSSNSAHTFSLEETNACALHIKNCANDDFFITKLNLASKDFSTNILGILKKYVVVV